MTAAPPPAFGPAITAIFGRERFGIKLGLDAMRALCDELGRPQQSAPSILIAGTNGKGSVAAMTAAALRSAGHRVGLYTSPHLVDLRERFNVDGAPVEASRLEAAAARVLATEAVLEARGVVSAPMTFFELTTAAAFEIFRDTGVDVMVLEVGLGGRLDATNVASPVVTAITSIDFDHMAQLGNSLEQIAFEKAGIIEPLAPVIVGPVPEPARSVIAAVALERQAPLVEAIDGVRAVARLDIDGRTRLALRTPEHEYGELKLALRGAHQVQNAIVAVRLLERLPAAGLAMPVTAIAAGLTGARWEGRLDRRVMADGRAVWLDAAHNQAGVGSLAAYLQAAGCARLPVVFGVSEDKDCVPMLQALAPVASRLVFTEASVRRARSAASLVALATSAGLAVPSTIARDPVDALHVAWSAASEVCVTGSIFLVGDILRHLAVSGAEQT